MDFCPNFADAGGTRLNKPDYEYRGLMASTWDSWRDDTADWPDRHFFREIVRQYGQPALDIGCGTGRIVLDYLPDGVDIDGVDNSPEMLAICRDKARKQGLIPCLLYTSPSPRDS